MVTDAIIIFVKIPNKLRKLFCIAEHSLSSICKNFCAIFCKTTFREKTFLSTLFFMGNFRAREISHSHQIQQQLSSCNLQFPEITFQPCSRLPCSFAENQKINNNLFFVPFVKYQT